MRQAVRAQRSDEVRAAVASLQSSGYSADVVVKRVMRDLLSARAAPETRAVPETRAAPGSRAEPELRVDADSGARPEAEQSASPCPCMGAAGLALAIQQCSFVDSNLQKGCDEELQLLGLGFFLAKCATQEAVSNGFILQQLQRAQEQ